MVEKWGYKLPDHPNDKGFRAAFRASSEHCIMTDMSYLECWQFQGPQATLLEGIQKFTSLEVGRMVIHHPNMNLSPSQLKNLIASKIEFLFSQRKEFQRN
jgi:hypothetical protein